MVQSPKCNPFAILHFHFEDSRDNEINPVQCKVGDLAERMKANRPKIRKLTEALQGFFP